MKYRFICISMTLASLLCLSAVTVAAAEGTAVVKMGYTFIDDEGHQGVNQETFNTYEGFGISILGLRYPFANNVTLGADIRSATLDNRDIRANLVKPGRFALSVSNNQYRRVYSYNGSVNTHRTQTGTQVSYQPSRFFKFCGGYAVSDKSGQTATLLLPERDMVVSSTDFAQSSFNFGTQIGDRHGMIKLDYRHFKFDDRTAADVDRKADYFAASMSSSVPRLKKLFVAGGYAYRQDKFDQQLTTALRTNELWGAIRASLPQDITAEYRIVYDMTRHTKPLREYDNQLHTAMVGKNWARLGGLQLGYERRVADDFISQTNSDGFIANAWCRPAEKWSLSARLTTRSKDVADGTTLMGAETSTRCHATVTYTDTAWGRASVRWQTRVRTNNDLNSKVDYQSISPEVRFKLAKYGSLQINYSYSTGEYENRSDLVSYEFRDHLLTGTITLATRYNVTADMGGTYYRSQRGQDIEKSNLNFGLSYLFLKNHHIEIRYNVFNYDDYLVNDSYYTGNIVEVNLIKDLSF